MPEFVFEGLVFQSPVELALHVIGGKWKMPILWRLHQREWRYNELHRDLKRVSHKMLTQQLRELEQAGLLTRTVHPVVPPHVDYAITPSRKHGTARDRGVEDMGNGLPEKAGAVSREA